MHHIILIFKAVFYSLEYPPNGRGPSGLSVVPDAASTAALASSPMNLACSWGIGCFVLSSRCLGYTDRLWPGVQRGGGILVCRGCISWIVLVGQLSSALGLVVVSYSYHINSVSSGLCPPQPYWLALCSYLLGRLGSSRVLTSLILSAMLWFWFLCVGSVTLFLLPSFPCQIESALGLLVWSKFSLFYSWSRSALCVSSLFLIYFLPRSVLARLRFWCLRYLLVRQYPGPPIGRYQMVAS